MRARGGVLECARDRKEAPHPARGKRRTSGVLGSRRCRPAGEDRDSERGRLAGWPGRLIPQKLSRRPRPRLRRPLSLSRSSPAGRQGRDPGSRAAGFRSASSARSKVVTYTKARNAILWRGCTASRKGWSSPLRWKNPTDLKSPPDPPPGEPCAGTCRNLPDRNPSMYYRQLKSMYYWY